MTQYHSATDSRQNCHISDCIAHQYADVQKNDDDDDVLLTVCLQEESLLTEQCDEPCDTSSPFSIRDRCWLCQCARTEEEESISDDGVASHLLIMEIDYECQLSIIDGCKMAKFLVALNVLNPSKQTRKRIIE